MAIATRDVVVLDCPDPAALARFYQQILGGEVRDEDQTWVDIVDRGDVRLAFQQAPGLVPPRWPSTDASQQIHLDFYVTDLPAAHEQVLAIGARPLDVDDEDGQRGFRVYADPAGHPFCLCRA